MNCRSQLQRRHDFLGSRKQPLLDLWERQDNWTLDVEDNEVQPALLPVAEQLARARIPNDTDMAEVWPGWFATFANNWYTQLRWFRANHGPQLWVLDKDPLLPEDRL